MEWILDLRYLEKFDKKYVMKSPKNLEELNKIMKSQGFQFNEKGELVFCDPKTKKGVQVGKLRSLDKAPKDEVEMAMKFYGLTKNKNNI
jgi:hypothetical protein